MNLSKSIYQIHFYFISLIAIHYIIPIIYVGQVIINPHDNLDTVVVIDHVISKIYKGDIEKLGYFLAGEIKWYNLERLFYPINILHYVLNDKLFYFTNDIFTKLLAYFSFYIFVKSLGLSRLNSALGGVLYSTLITSGTYIDVPMGLAMPFLPYILYLLLNKDTLNKKHYIVLFLVGLNSSIFEDIFAIILLVPFSFLLNNKNKNLNIYLQVYSVFFISLILSNMHVIIGTILSDTIHREAWSIGGFYGSVVAGNDAISPFLNVFKTFITYRNTKSALFIFYVPLASLAVLTLVLSLFSKQKNIKLISFFIIFILILKSLMDHSIIDNILIGIFDILKGYSFQRVDRILPIALTLLFLLVISNLKNKSFSKFLFFLSLLSIFSVQLKTPLPIIGQHFLRENMNMEKFEKTKKAFLEQKYIQFYNLVIDKKNYASDKTNFNNSINQTFDNYYKFKDYAFIKNIVKNSRVMSVGLDPMIAVMNDIKVIDGYHASYPLNYKIKFRKIIERELEKNIRLKNYYDNWGNRVYAFYTDENNIMLNFHSAQKLGADYVISKFPIESSELKIVCYECNNSSKIFLYKIL